MRPEDSEQISVVSYARRQRIPVYHVPNEGKRDYYQTEHLKRKGMSPGIPDLCFPVARGGYHSLYIEMKAGRNTTTKRQDAWLAYLDAAGFKTAVCYSAEEAIEVVDAYMQNC